MAGYPQGNPQYPGAYPPLYPHLAYDAPVPGAVPGYPGFHQPTAPPQHPASMSYPSPTPVYPGYPTVQAMPPVEWIPCTDVNAGAYEQRAVVAGFEGHDGSPLLVMRAHHQGDIIPGKLAIKHKSAYVPWGGNEVRVHQIEVCVAQPERIRWVQSQDGHVPPNAVPGGRVTSGETLYIGRAKEQGSLTPGKIHPSHKVMYMSFGGHEIPHKVYEVLCFV